MIRKLAFFLVLLLPLQFAWAGVASYCQHETTAAQERHVGHHEHAHQGSVEKSAGLNPGGDNDCGTCHATGSALLSDGLAVTAPSPSPSTYASHDRRRIPDALARAPDRPQWLGLASPARRSETTQS